MGACLSTSKPARGTTVQVKAISAERAAAVRERLNKLFEEKHCYHCEPIMVRLAWHDAGSYSHEAAASVPWPKAGGATGSIRFKPELSHGANAGLAIALDLLKPVKEEFPYISWSDLIQLASAQAIEHAGGPHIPLRLGRLDAESAEQCAPDGRLPAAAAPFPDKAANPAAHLRNVFVKGYGLTDKDIVALSGAHTLGRARPERSGFGKEKTKYTENGPGAPGGQSWTPEWVKFDNSYFVEIKEQRDADLLVLPTDACIFEDEGFRPYAEKYAADQEAFFKDYVESHLKLSELGAKFA